MSAERREHKRYSVNWRGRISLADKSLHQIVINDVSKGGIGIVFPYAVSSGSAINIEFFVRYRNEKTRIRAKTVVVFNAILSGNRGAKLGLQFTSISKECMHTLCNILLMLEDGSYR